MISLSLNSLRPLQAMAASILFRKRRLMLILPRQKGGKTELGVRLAHDLTIRPDQSSSLFLAKSKGAGRKAAREKFMRLFDKRLFEVNTELAYLRKCPTSCVFMDSVDKEPDRLRGGTYDFIHWSEVAFSKFEHGQTVHDVWGKVIDPTLTETDGYVLLESTTNGKNGWHDLWENAGALGFNRLLVSLSDMVYLGLCTVEEYDRLKARTLPDIFDQEYECKFVSFQGQIYAEYKEDLHMVKDMPGPEEWQTVFMGIDWGYHPSATCVLFAYVRENCLWIFDEHYETKELTEHTGNAINAKLAYWDAKKLSAVADHEPDRIEELNRRGIPCRAADKVNVQGNRIQGKELVFL